MSIGKSSYGKGPAPVAQKPAPAVTQAPKVVPTPPEPKRKEEPLPTFVNYKAWLLNKTITVSAPAGSALCAIYGEPKDITSPGHFQCTVIDMVCDPATGRPLTMLVRYRLKNARRFFYFDCLDVSTPGISISVELEIEQEEDMDEGEEVTAAIQ